MPYFDEYSGFDQSMKEDPKEQRPAPPQRKSNAEFAANTLFDYVELLALTVFFILIATLFLFRHAVVDGSSMLRTLEHGEHLIISDAFYLSPASGDIIVFEDNEQTGSSGPLIKRIIATEGQTVIITKDGVIVHDGHVSYDDLTKKQKKPLDESYIYLFGNSTAMYNDYLEYGKAQDRFLGAYDPENEVFTYHIGEDEVFVLGDNRFNSLDSRYFGPIETDCILGRVLFRITPLSKFGGVG